MDTIKRALTALCLIAIALTAAAQKVNFTCESFDYQTEIRKTGLDGFITLTEDDEDIPVILVEASEPGNSRGALPFGFWTSQDEPVALRHQSKMNDPSTGLDRRDVYWLTNDPDSGDDECMIVYTGYSNGQPTDITMITMWRGRPSQKITIPYSERVHRGVYRIIELSEDRIPYVYE